MSDLVNRLRECVIPEIREHLNADYVKAETIGDVARAADLIQSQAARIERLEAALRKISEYLPLFDYCGSDEFGVRVDRPGSPHDRGREREAKHLSSIARAALKEGQS